MTVDVFTVIITGVGISLVPLSMDLLSMVVPVGRDLQRQLGYLLVITMILLSLAGLWTFFYIYLPYWVVYMNLSEGMRIVLILIAVWLWVNVNYSYFRASLFSHERARERLLLNQSKKHESNQDDEKSAKETPVRFCNRCKRNRSPSEHHCRSCDICISNMDHHCNYLHSCVSLGPDGNFHYFYIWLVYISAGLIYCLVLSWPSFTTCLLDPFSIEVDSVLYKECKRLGNFILLFVPLFLMFVPLAVLLILQSILMIRGQTTLEFFASLTGRHMAPQEERKNVNLRWYHWVMPVLLEVFP